MVIHIILQDILRISMKIFENTEIISCGELGTLDFTHQSTY